GFNQTPNSCVVDGTGAIYVGFSDGEGGFGGGGLAKLNSAGVVQETFTPDPGARGTDNIDLADDQCTLYYTSSGTSIKRFDVCKNKQLWDFCTGCDDGAGGAISGVLWALRLLPDHSVLVAHSDFASNIGLVRRYNSSGALMKTYAAVNAAQPACGPNADQPCFFPYALALDMDRASFWAADNVTGEIFRFDLNSGDVLDSFRAGDCNDFHSTCNVTGLAIACEPRAATTPCPLTATISAADKVYDATTDASITHCTLSGVLGGDEVT